jgi:surface carbohydrate biosynthesis protein
MRGWKERRRCFLLWVWAAGDGRLFAGMRNYRYMATNKKLLLIPVENQAREQDPKLLLAAVATTRGFSSVFGSRREMEFNIDLFPRSIYLSKSMTVRSLLFFRVARRFNVEIVSWDEEALVHLPPETYFSRRLDPKAIKYISHLFAWGDENARLWRLYPALPREIPIDVTGNPRSDLLRPELQPFYHKEVEELKAAYGDFILVNTNFNHVNAFGPDMNLFKLPAKTGRRQRFGRAARGMSRTYAEGLRDHKNAVFEDFKRLIPRLEQSFPNHSIVVRPHPTENHDVYRDIAARCRRIYVTNEKSVVPWLLAARAVIHNGCTTGVEAYLVGTPALSYRASINETYDNGFYRLPNRMSHQCFSFEELEALLHKILEGDIRAADGDERKRLADDHLEAQSGPLACERIVDVLEVIEARQRESNANGPYRSLQSWMVKHALHVAKGIKSHLPGHHNRPEFQRHRYPGISPAEVQERLHRFLELLGSRLKVRVEPISDVLVRIDA